LNQILRRQTSRSHYGSKAPVVTVTVFKYRNKIGKIFVKAVPYDGNSSLCQRQGELKTTNNDLQNTTLKTKDRVTRTPLKNKNELRYIPLYNNWLKTMYKTWSVNFSHQVSDAGSGEPLVVLAITLSVLRFTSSDYLFAIFNLFLKQFRHTCTIFVPLLGKG
jgi:hypothetical protein